MPHPLLVLGKCSLLFCITPQAFALRSWDRMADVSLRSHVRSADPASLRGIGLIQPPTLYNAPIGLKIAGDRLWECYKLFQICGTIYVDYFDTPDPHFDGTLTAKMVESVLIFRNPSKLNMFLYPHSTL